MRYLFLQNDSHIIPIHLYEPELCKQAANVLIDEHGIYIQPIFYPTVPKGDERFRVTITPKHSASDVESFVRSLDKVWSGLNLKELSKVSAKVESKVSKILLIFKEEPRISANLGSNLICAIYGEFINNKCKSYYL